MTDDAARTARDDGPPPRIWPLTALVVLCGFLVAGLSLFGAVIGTAPFFGDIPSRTRYIEAGLVALTALVPIGLMATIGRLLGSGWGLLLLALPAVVLVGVGIQCLGSEGDERDPDPGRAVRLSDLFGEGVVLNWVAGGVLLVAAVLIWHRRRPGRRSVIPTP